MNFANSRNVVYCVVVRHESSLLGAVAAFDGWESTMEDDHGKELAGDGEKGRMTSLVQSLGSLSVFHT